MRVRLALEWFLNPDHVPFLVGLERGWFAEAGIELELVEPKEHVDAADALAREELEVAITEPIHLAQDLSASRASSTRTAA
jgi:ABC-type nitrate/sulfonate/bicarbonate transport system substrate-binding protein